MLFKLTESNYILLFLLLKMEKLVKIIMKINYRAINKNNYLE